MKTYIKITSKIILLLLLSMSFAFAMEEEDDETPWYTKAAITIKSGYLFAVEEVDKFFSDDVEWQQEKNDADELWKDDSTQVDINMSDADRERDKKQCGEHILTSEYIPKLKNNEFPQGLNEAWGHNINDSLAISRHYCRLANNIPSFLPEKYRDVDTASGYSGAVPVAFNEGGIFPPPGSEEYPDDNIVAILHQDIDGFKVSACQKCHENQAVQWRGSAHNYATGSPTFQAFELALREQRSRATTQAGVHDPNDKTTQFCYRCHAPTAFHDSSDLGPLDPESQQLAHEAFSDNEFEGVSCITCHTAIGVNSDEIVPREGRLGDGVANAAINNTFSEQGLLVGFNPIDDPVLLGPLDPDSDDVLSPHGAQQWEFANTDNVPDTLAGCLEPDDSSRLCFACHDVRLTDHDPSTGEPFKRLENLVTEYCDYRNKCQAQGKKVHTCVDCHMSAYGTFPGAEPGSFPNAPISNITDKNREYHVHSFHAVTNPIIDGDGRYTNIDTLNLDRFGIPLGKVQRKNGILEKAMDIRIKPDSQKILRDGDNSTLVLNVEVENTGTGHGVPSGFSQERETWLKVEVKDDNGNVVYKSGYTWAEVDDKTKKKYADELGISLEELNEYIIPEDLAAELVRLDPDTFEVINPSNPEEIGIAPNHGPDYNTRFEGHGPAKGGKNFRNRFLRRGADGKDIEVFSPALANVYDNDQSLLPCDGPEEVKYEIPVDPNYKGSYDIQVQGQFRPFPPHFADAVLKSELARAQRQNREPVFNQEMYDSLTTPSDMGSASLKINTSDIQVAATCLHAVDNMPRKIYMYSNAEPETDGLKTNANKYSAYLNVDEIKEWMDKDCTKLKLNDHKVAECTGEILKEFKISTDVELKNMTPDQLKEEFKMVAEEAAKACEEYNLKRHETLACYRGLLDPSFNENFRTLSNEESQEAIQNNVNAALLRCNPKLIEAIVNPEAVTQLLVNALSQNDGSACLKAADLEAANLTNLNANELNFASQFSEIGENSEKKLKLYLNSRYSFEQD